MVDANREVSQYGRHAISWSVKKWHTYVECPKSGMAWRGPAFRFGPYMGNMKKEIISRYVRVAGPNSALGRSLGCPVRYNGGTVIFRRSTDTLQYQWRVNTGDPRICIVNFAALFMAGTVPKIKFSNLNYQLCLERL